MGASPAAASKTVWAELTFPEAVDLPALTRQARRAAALADLIAGYRPRAAVRPGRNANRSPVGGAHAGRSERRHRAGAGL